MIQLNLPQFEIKLSGTPEKPKILDILRRKFVALTPEEWVRQHFIHYLVEHKGYPASLLANEIPLTIGDKTLRADSVLYSRELQPKMIIEYKAPHIPISQKVFDQITAYNMLLHVDYLVVSNGMEHYICKMDYASKKYLFLEDIPNYVIGLNSVSLDSGIDFAKKYNIPLYGIGGSDQNVNALDEGIIQSMLVPDVFMMGYNSVQLMVQRIKFPHERKEKIIDFYTINKENMFSKQNESILFPIGD